MRTSHQCRDCSWSIPVHISGRNNSSHHSLLSTLGCQLESQGSTRAEAQMRVFKASEAQARHSTIGLSTKIRLWQALVRSVLLFTRGNRETCKLWKNGKSSNTTHCKIPCSCVSGAHARLGKRLRVHTVVSTLQVRSLLWAKKWLREETYPEDERTGAVVFGGHRLRDSPVSSWKT